MKTPHIIPLAIMAILIGAADGAVVFDSLNNVPGINSGLNPVGSNPNSGRAMNFTIPAGSSYNLTSMVFHFGGIADAGTETPEITVWSNDSVSPASPVGTLLTTLTLSGPLVDGLNTFTSTGLILDPNTTYWVVVRNLGGSPMTWTIGTNSPTTGTSSGGVVSASAAEVDPTTWTNPYTGIPAVQVNADAIPEPTVALLSSVGLFGLMRRRRI